MGHFDQIPSGRPNGFHLGPKGPWKGNQPSRRAFRPDLFAIWAPRRRWHRIRILTMAGDLFGGDAPDQRDSGANGPAPLAERLRPRTLADVVGQEHLTGPEGAIGRMVAAGQLASIIFWGPPGTGKTKIARLLADAG